jgi:2,5-diketo-D-gluconate reductase A
MPPNTGAENFDIFNFELDSTDMTAVATLAPRASVFFDHRNPAIVKWLGGVSRNT